MVDIKSIDELLNMNLALPNYQRPYKWTYKNMVDLLGDLSDAVTNAEKYDNFKYRVGTVILHEVSEEAGKRFDIVDGQQRALSLALIMLSLNNSYTCPLLENSDFNNKITQANLHNNFIVARDYLSNDPSRSSKLMAALENTIEVVVVCVDKVTEAFQLFDSQNTRGRALDPHDLLKAYHLREMREYPYEMRHAVTKWEAADTKSIRELFALYLFPIKNWSNGQKSYSFTARDIDCYKGVSEYSSYTYAQRANNAMPYFQITEPFLAGGSFFEMVAHYLELLSDIKSEIQTNNSFEAIRTILNKKEYRSAGFSYATNLFYCALLCYYDRFRNFDKRAIKKLFTWAFMLRVDLENLGFDSVNKYAVGEEGKYSNTVKMFSIITNARLHSEIANIPLNVIRTPDNATVTKWDELYTAIKEMNGIGGALHE
jgi:uncharacterized protein with ParB-like and HNH nuclease domain